MLSTFTISIFHSPGALLLIFCAPPEKVACVPSNELLGISVSLSPSRSKIVISLQPRPRVVFSVVIEMSLTPYVP